MYHKYVEMHEAINLKKSGGNKKTKALWSMRDAKAGGEAYYDRGVLLHERARTAGGV